MLTLRHRSQIAAIALMLLSAACVPAQSGGSIAAKPTESAGSAAAKPTESAGSAAARPTESAGSTAAKPAESATRRVVFAVPQPMVESNEPRNIGQTYMWQLTPMYEY
ncbi:MAG TPA: hypothetical protein VHX16_07330 [Chloroflexota bacterium]|nr:hypothetical protein [Chloroflexota bacterium]